MAAGLSISRYGEHAWLVTTRTHAPAILARAISEQLDRHQGPLSQHIDEAVPGAQAVLIVASPTAPAIDLETDLTTLLTELDLGSATTPGTTEISLEVSYDGDDLHALAAELNMSPEAIVRLHSQATYEVAFCGFSPGFAYLTGLPEELHVPRLSTPRPQVPAGSVAIADSYSAVYPQASPGGWRLLGHTKAILFDLDKTEPALLQPGTQVRFTQTKDSAKATTPAASSPSATPYPHTDENDNDASDGFALTIESPGSLTLIQDLGRYGWRHLGVSNAGAFDIRAAQQANILASNPPDSALLETIMGNLRFRTHQPVTMALAGAPTPVLVTTTSESFEPATRTSIHLPAGSTVELAAPTTGLRTYIAFTGGIDVNETLNSRSRDTLGEIGPEPLLAGQKLKLLPSTLTTTQSLSTEPKPPLVSDAVDPEELGTTDLASVDLVAALAATERPDGLIPILAAQATQHAGLIHGNLAELMGKRIWTVGDHSSRIGIRMSGDPLPIDYPTAWESEPTLPGSIQVAPNGELIVFGPDGPTTGGYPVIAVATREALDTLSQSRPGSQLRIDINR